MIKGSKSDVIDKGNWTDTECPVCGKNFIPTPQWAYKTPVGVDANTKAVCSYGCLMRAKREREELFRQRTEERKRENKRRGDPFCNGGIYKRRVICLDTGVIYESVVQAAKDTGCSTSGITEVCKGRREITKKHRFKYYEGET